MGRLKREKTIPLSVFYLKYFAYLFLGVLVLAVCVIGGFNGLVLKDMIYPADYAQEQASLAYDTILQADEIREEMIPDLCRYLVFDTEGKVKSGDMEEKDIENAWNVVKGQSSYFGGYYYKVIPREGEYCVLRYQITPQYRSEVLRQYLLPPQTLLIVCTLLLVFFIVICTAACFGRALKKKLEPLIQATERIQNRELEFSIASSDIKEVDAVLKSMEQMREALRDSLEMQWRLEQSKKEQISALAHDLKTPLTLIRGNAELLYDMELSGEQRDCVDYIESSSLQMQTYVQTLIEVAKSECVQQFQKQDVELSAFLQEIKKQSQGLCAVKQITLQWKCDVPALEVSMDGALFARALMNVVANAVDHTPSGGEITFEARREEGDMVFVVTDTGKGFSQEALRHAAEQFYMEDGSRGSRTHFGIGLYVADSIVKQHGGSLILENSRETQGAKVMLKIPC